MKNSEYLPYLYQALKAEFGVALATSDLNKTRQILYKLRKTDPALSVLKFRQSPVNPNHLWITKDGEEKTN